MTMRKIPKSSPAVMRNLSVRATHQADERSGDGHAMIRELLARPAPDSAPSPDAALLAACDAILSFDRQADALRAAMGQTKSRKEWFKLHAELEALGGPRRAAAIKARKLRATTPAGLYAKALLLERSANITWANVRDFARDFRANLALRRVLWPAEVV